MTPDDTHKLFARYFQNRDLERLASLYDENAIFFPGKGKEPVCGREKIKEALQPCLDSSCTVETVSRSVRESGDIALVKEVCRIKSAAGMTEGNALEVLRRSADGSWRYLIYAPYGI